MFIFSCILCSPSFSWYLLTCYCAYVCFEWLFLSLFLVHFNPAISNVFIFVFVRLYLFVFQPVCCSSAILVYLLNFLPSFWFLCSPCVSSICLSACLFVYHLLYSIPRSVCCFYLRLPSAFLSVLYAVSSATLSVSACLSVLSAILSAFLSSVHFK
jgi:hypothetical protein